MNKISKVKVTGLHGYKENTVSVDFLPNKPMSYIVGWNGIGKSTLLKLLTTALTPNKKNAKELDSIKFNVLEIIFSNGDILSVEQKISKRGTDNPNKDWGTKDFLKPLEVKYNYSWKIKTLNESITGIYQDGKLGRSFIKGDKIATEKKLKEKLRIIKIDLLSCEKYYDKNFDEFNFFDKDGKLREKECEIFKKVISNPGLTDKYIQIASDRENKGQLEIIPDYKKVKGRAINFENLSRGEKNLLLLYYYLIFKIPNKLPEDTVYLQLIDTPEINIHIDSMITFYDNLQYINQELGRNNNYQFAIATHSPAITYSHNELMREMRRMKNVE